jgi:hypothetical protein
LTKQSLLSNPFLDGTIDCAVMMIAAVASSNKTKCTIKPYSAGLVVESCFDSDEDRGCCEQQQDKCTIKPDCAAFENA